ncbi:hypothetical protein CYMTET_48146 [Cymbomonas tetramitiformis]|uniref:Metallo-beta-lactamase domain-containing protein n=1 Tax=Cymbomonas tetramitiformis TaxID=36881 RepID=A0AAE0EX07_9CHLO|nr:hypothetical protein CYMTET_48146 [Cymbomonas tetramitiformis]
MVQKTDTRPREAAIVESVRTNSFGTFGHLLGCAETFEAAVIDPGGPIASLLEKAKQTNLTINKILITHEHLDHIAGVAALKQALPAAEIYIHPAGVPMYHAKGVPVPFAEWESLWSSWMGRRIVDSVSSTLLGAPYEQPNEPDHMLQGGDTVTVGSLSVRVSETPGHAAGAVSLFVDQEGLIFTGDTVMGGVVGRTDLPGASGFDMFSSLKHLTSEFENACKDATLYTGHAPPTLVSTELSRNIYLNNTLRFVPTHILGNALFVVLLWFAWSGFKQTLSLFRKLSHPQGKDRVKLVEKKTK